MKWTTCHHRPSISTTVLPAITARRGQWQYPSLHTQLRGEESHGTCREVEELKKLYRIIASDQRNTAALKLVAH